ncbi:hypothetical protein F4810DRAFT_676608 [Camillea tinctor]|nr:hypothetical protein F4810DRAFT_676608 [Camillea tinctor]
MCVCIYMYVLLTAIGGVEGCTLTMSWIHVHTYCKLIPPSPCPCPCQNATNVIIARWESAAFMMCHPCSVLPPSVFPLPQHPRGPWPLVLSPSLFRTGQFAADGGSCSSWYHRKGVCPAMRVKKSL